MALFVIKLYQLWTIDDGDHNLVIVFFDQLMNFDSKILIFLLKLLRELEYDIIEWFFSVINHTLNRNKFRIFWFVYLKDFHVDDIVMLFRTKAATWIFWFDHAVELFEKALVHVFDGVTCFVYYKDGFIKVVVDLFELLVKFVFQSYQLEHIRYMSTNQSNYQYLEDVKR